MIQAIDIENFRCFHKSHFEGFKRINLIGGQNNSGKTALLEAIYWVNNPKDFRKILLLRERSGKQQSKENDTELSSDSWEDLIHKRKPCIMKINTYDKEHLSKFNKGDFYINSFGLALKVEEQMQQDTKENILVKMSELSLNNQSASHQHDDFNGFIVFDNTKYFKPDSSSFKTSFFHEISKIGITDLKELRIDSDKFPDWATVFIQSHTTLKGFMLAKAYDNVYKNAEDPIIDEAFRLFIPDFENARPVDSERPSLYIKTKGNKPLPISMYGDAVNRIAEFVIRILNARGGILLIDEIENGIHYSHQKEVWSMLFKLAKHFDVQIFATSHSLEMIRAFNEVAQEESNEKEAQFMEMFRSARSGEIVINALTHSALAYAIRNGLSFRGGE